MQFEIDIQLNIRFIIDNARIEHELCLKLMQNRCFDSKANGKIRDNKNFSLNDVAISQQSALFWHNLLLLFLQRESEEEKEPENVVESNSSRLFFYFGSEEDFCVLKIAQSRIVFCYFALN